MLRYLCLFLVLVFRLIVLLYSRCFCFWFYCLLLVCVWTGLVVLLGLLLGMVWVVYGNFGCWFWICICLSLVFLGLGGCSVVWMDRWV